MLEKLKTCLSFSRTLISPTPAQLSDSRSMESSVRSHQRVLRYESGLMTVLLRAVHMVRLQDWNCCRVFWDCEQGNLYKCFLGIYNQWLHISKSQGIEQESVCSWSTKAFVSIIMLSWSKTLTLVEKSKGTKSHETDNSLRAESLNCNSFISLKLCEIQSHELQVRLYILFVIWVWKFIYNFKFSVSVRDKGGYSIWS